MRKNKTPTQKRNANQATIVSFFKPPTNPPEHTPKPITSHKQASVSPLRATVAKAQNQKSALPELDEDDPRWAALHRRVASEEGVGKTMAERILRWFDRNPIYGPGVGIGRLERWKRANKLDLQPPQEVRQILETRQGQEDARLKMHGIGL